MKLFKTLWLGLLTCLGIGTMLGKDKRFSLSLKTKIGPWYVVEMSAADRQVFIDLAQQIGAQEGLSATEQAQMWMNMRMQAIATCLRNRFGYLVYDPLNAHHLNEISELPERLLKEVLKTIDTLSTMPWLVIPEAANDEDGGADCDESDDEEERHVNP